MQDKAALRRAALSKRRALTDRDHQAAEARLVSLCDDLNIAPGATVAGFWPIRREINPLPLMRILRDRGARLCLPAVVDAVTIVFRHWCLDAELIETGFGTMGPDESAPVVDPDVILVPIAAFDRRGGRIGYGAGYYDRAIETLHAGGRRPDLIGLAFACQETDRVPLEPHDQLLHRIVTELELIQCQTDDHPAR